MLHREQPGNHSIHCDSASNYVQKSALADWYYDSKDSHLSVKLQGDRSRHQYRGQLSGKENKGLGAVFTNMSSQNSGITSSESNDS